MKKYTITIIGAGSVGATTAYALILKNIPAEIILVDVDKERCHGEVLDLQDALGFSSTPSVRNGDTQDARNADIIIIAAGFPQKKGQKRRELFEESKRDHGLKAVAFA